MKRFLLAACLVAAVGCSGKPPEVDQATVVQPDPAVKPAPASDVPGPVAPKEAPK